MMLASAVNASLTTGLEWAPISRTGDCLLLGRRSAHLVPMLRTHSRPILSLTFARRRNPNPTTITPSHKSNKKRLGDDEDEIEDIDDDALEALFKQLEEDLKNEDPGLDDEDYEDLSQEDLEKLNKEMADLDEELSQVFDMTGFESEDEFEDEDEILEETDDGDMDHEDDDSDEEEEPLQLRNWQLRRLALALKTGRRKTNIKSLAAELCIDRSIVLELLRNPPPDLLMLSAALPDDEPSSPIITITEAKTIETEVETAPKPDTTPKTKVAGKVSDPVHVMQERYSSEKRLKKAHIYTLEDVYRRTKRPTNAMIKSIVDVTNLPRKRVVKWFEDKRSEEGVPEERIPYQRHVPDTAQ